MSIKPGKLKFTLFVLVGVAGISYTVLYIFRRKLDPEVKSYDQLMVFPPQRVFEQKLNKEATFNEVCKGWDIKGTPFQEIDISTPPVQATKTLTSLSNVTSYSNSIVTLVNRKPFYRLCDHIAIRIEARDSNNMSKQYGGDYFRVKIYSDKPYSSSGPDHFIDYHNGTYIALFTLKWVANVSVHVSLVHPSEAIPILKRTTLGGQGGKLFEFTGIFKTARENNTYEETVTCGTSDFPAPSCNLSANDTHGPWFCKRPKDSHLSCKDWSYHHLRKSSGKKLEASLSTVEKAMFKTTKKSLKPIEPMIVVHSNVKRPALATCSSFHVPDTIHTRGYFINGTWQPYGCTLRSFTSNETRVCLQNKRLHLFGDSTARQMFVYLKENLQWTCHETFRCTKGNATLRFKFHGLPIRDSATIPVYNLSYVAQEIDKLKGGPDLVIVLSVWAHFGQPEGSFYRDRLLSIKEAVKRLWQRSPESRVIVRSANTREHTIRGFILISSDWIARQGEMILREVFSEDKRFEFLDAWDITNVQQAHDNVHPYKATLSQIIAYLLTIICPNSS